MARSRVGARTYAKALAPLAELCTHDVELFIEEVLLGDHDCKRPEVYLAALNLIELCNYWSELWACNLIMIAENIKELSPSRAEQLYKRALKSEQKCNDEISLCHGKYAEFLMDHHRWHEAEKIIILGFDMMPFGDDGIMGSLLHSAERLWIKMGRYPEIELAKILEIRTYGAKLAG